MPYEAYKVLHVFSVLLTFTVLGGLALHSANGGNRGSNQSRKLTSALQGLGLLMILIAGFGLLARLGSGFPLWVLLKLAIWMLVGASAVVIRRSPAISRALLLLLPILGGIAAWLAVYKPFVD